MSFNSRLIVGIVFIIFAIFLAFYFIFLEKKVNRFFSKRFPAIEGFFNRYKFKEGLEIRRAIVILYFLIMGIYFLISL
jgi:flagellar biosynthesis protein FlhB